MDIWQQPSASCTLLPPRQKNSSKKILLRHRQYVQLICVGLLLQGVFYRERLLLFHLKNISNRQKECSRQCKSFSGVFSWSRRQCHLGGHFALARHKNISFFLTFFFDQTDRRVDLGHWTLCILKPENACIGISLKVLIQDIMWITYNVDVWFSRYLSVTSLAGFYITQMKHVWNSHDHCARP